MTITTQMFFFFIFTFFLIFFYKHFKAFEKFVDYYILRKQKCFIKNESNENELEECSLISKIKTVDNEEKYLVKKYTNYYSKYFVVDKNKLFF